MNWRAAISRNVISRNGNVFHITGHLWGEPRVFSPEKVPTVQRVKDFFVVCLNMTSSNGNISAILALCAGNSPVTGEFPSQRPVTQSFDVLFSLRLSKRLSKQSWASWFETPSRSLWHYCNVSSSSDGAIITWWIGTARSHNQMNLDDIGSGINVTHSLYDQFIISLGGIWDGWKWYF